MEIDTGMHRSKIVEEIRKCWTDNAQQELSVLITQIRICLSNSLWALQLDVTRLLSKAKLRARFDLG